jgi:hypothetical protein
VGQAKRTHQSASADPSLRSLIRPTRLPWVFEKVQTKTENRELFSITIFYGLDTACQSVPAGEAID